MYISKLDVPPHTPEAQYLIGKCPPGQLYP